MMTKPNEMTNQTEKYKGYLGTFVADHENGRFYGEVIGVRDVIVFSGKTLGETLKDFKAGVDDYLAWAEEEGFDPQVPK